jgi:hypothetical protein
MTLDVPPARSPAPRVLNTNSVWPWASSAADVAGASLPEGVHWPSISIVTPNYNYAGTLERTVRSVLNQGYRRLEYVVVDDGSTDGSVDIVRRYEGQLAHWTHRANRGQYESVNEGFRRTGGEVMAWLDSDDIYLPWTLWSVGHIFATCPDVQWVVGPPAVFQDGVLHHVPRRRPFPRALIRSGLFHGTPGGLGWIPQEHMFWRRSLWERAGELRTHLTVGADFDMNVRFARHAELYVCSTLLGGYTLRPGQNRGTVEREQYVLDIASVLREIRAAEPESARLAARVARYRRFRKVPLLRRIIRSTCGIDRCCRGPILQWNFDAGAYRVEYEPYFD